MPLLQKKSETLQDIIDTTKLQDYEHRLLAIGKALTTDGVQWGAGVEGADDNYTTLAGVQTEFETAFSLTVDPGTEGNILWIEIAATIGLASNNDNSTCKWKWQGRPVGGSWADLHDEVTEADIDIAEKEMTRQGFALLSAIPTVPYQVRLLVMPTSDTDTITARVKSSSYARAIYNVD
jgi:hypothetical protein